MVRQKEQIVSELNMDIEHLTQDRSILADKLLLQREQFEQLSSYYGELQSKYSLIENQLKTYQAILINCEAQFKDIKNGWTILEQKFTQWQSIIDGVKIPDVEMSTTPFNEKTLVEDKGTLIDMVEPEPQDESIEEITNMEAIAKSISEQVSKIGDSLAALKMDVADKDEGNEVTNIPSTIFIYGGEQKIANLWGDYIETYLNEFSLMYEWIFDIEKISNSNARGIVFLIDGNVAKIKEQVVYAKENKIPYIEHALSNITRLKIDIFDNFLRPSVS